MPTFQPEPTPCGHAVVIGPKHPQPRSANLVKFESAVSASPSFRPRRIRFSVSRTGALVNRACNHFFFPENRSARRAVFYSRQSHHAPRPAGSLPADIRLRRKPQRFGVHLRRANAVRRALAAHHAYHGLF